MLEAEPCVYSIPEKRNGLGRHGRRFGNLYCARESPGSCPFEPRMKLPGTKSSENVGIRRAKRPFPATHRWQGDPARQDRSA